MCLYMSSFILVMSCNNWILIWLGLEINMISFIMIIYVKYGMMNIESCIKYFFIQSLGSVILLMFMYLSLNAFSLIGSVILCYKMGGGPFFFWFPYICKDISWWSCFFLMSFQKVIPMMLISLFMSSMVWIMGMISLVVGVMGSMNQVGMKELMAYSSVHHIGWMMVSFMVSDDFWWIYLLIYSMMLLSVIMILDNELISQIFSVMKFESKILITLMMLNLGGVPPMMGFFLKWWSFYYFLEYDYSMMMLLLMFSVIMLYIYFRIVYDFVMGGMEEFSWKVSVKKKIMYYYDNLILASFCMGPLVGIMFL